MWWLTKRRALQGEPDAVRKALVEIVASRREEAVELCIEVHKRPDWLVKTHAARALGELGAAAGVPVLALGIERAGEAQTRARFDSFGRVRSEKYLAEAVRALSRIGGPNAVAPLLRLIAQGVAREQAVEALRGIGSDALAPMCEALAAGYSEPDGRMDVADAFVDLALPVFGQLPFVPGCIQVLCSLIGYDTLARRVFELLEKLLAEGADRIAPSDLEVIAALPVSVAAAILDESGERVGEELFDCSQLIRDAGGARASLLG